MNSNITKQLRNGNVHDNLLRLIMKHSSGVMLTGQDGDRSVLVALGEKQTTKGLSWQCAKRTIQTSQRWWFGHLSYDLKNEFEHLPEPKEDVFDFGRFFFFSPEVVLRYDPLSHRIAIVYGHESALEGMMNRSGAVRDQQGLSTPMVPDSTPSPDEYQTQFDRLQQHIQRGDIYEVTYSIEHGGSGKLDPVKTYSELLERTKAPHGGFYKVGDNYLLCGSPERYLQHKNGRLVSQPIKGTAKRDNDPATDIRLRDHLRTDEKERAENIMITDLVRNDLSRIAKRNSVQVDELCEVYSYKTVHQMISTISAQLEEGRNPLDAIDVTFPMGSMTGAPKIRAMELIDACESFPRGLYSGSIGYIDPEMNFDLNVVIRSILYNDSAETYAIRTGSALTSLSNAEFEYNECLLKAQSMLDAIRT